MGMSTEVIPSGTIVSLSSGGGWTNGALIQEIDRLFWVKVSAAISGGVCSGVREHSA
jgi:hypothetical protein